MAGTRERLDHRIGRTLGAWVRWLEPRPWRVLAAVSAATLVALVLAVTRLGIDTDTIRLFPEELPARIHHEAFASRFPDLENALFIVVDAADAGSARDGARALAQALRADGHFDDAYVPGSNDFFDRNGLLYRSVDELEIFAEQLARLQPVVAALEQDPSLANLTRLVDRGPDEVGPGGDAEWSRDWARVLDRIGDTTVKVYEEFPVALSWEDLFLQGSSVETRTRQVVVALPQLDFDALLPARDALARVRAAAAALDPHLRVRVTGNPALAHEETLGLAWDLGVAGLACMAVVAGILLAALRSARAAAALCQTLVVGCIWAAGFAALAVGKLNVISMSAGILFLGLGVDYGIHLGTRYMHLRRFGRAHGDAMVHAVREGGGALVVCSLTTSIGFFAFLPTDYRGVAEFGLITGVGLLIMLALTLTLFPALLAGPLRIASVRTGASALAFRAEWIGRALERHRRTVVVGALACAALALLSLPRARFEPNIVAMRDPSTASVRAFEDLLADAGGTSPWVANLLAEDDAEAARLVAALRAQPAVGRALWLADFVPDDQDEKRAVLEDLAMLLDAPVPAATAAVETAAAPREQIATLRRLQARLAALPLSSAVSSPLAKSVAALRQRLGRFLARVDDDADPERALRSFERLLLGSLPADLARLQRALEPERVTRATLPPRLVRRMRAHDGTLRVQAFPGANLNDPAAFAHFVEAVAAVDPGATGVAVNLVAFARTTKSAFRQALVAAAVAIFAVLWGLWRRIDEVLLVMVPLALAALLTAGAMALLGVPFSFFNVVVLPLMLGAGVDAGVHLVDRAREVGAAELLSTTSARAVFYSSLTTVVSFGSLALSAHRGLAGLGALLTFGMLMTLVCTMVVLPALIAWRATARRQSSPSTCSIV